VALAMLGLTLLVPRGADRAAVLLAPSLHRPPRFHASGATSDSALAARLPWVLAAGRILQALALRARHELQRGRGAAAALAALDAWLATLAGEDGPLAEASAQFPQEGVVAARLRVRLPQGTPGAAHKLAIALP
jgi:predicted component of type VI protein secretion system